MVIRKALVALAVLCCAALGPPAMASPADDLGLSNLMVQTPSNDSTVADISALPVSIRQAADTSALGGSADVLQVESIALRPLAAIAPLEVGATAYTG